MRLYELESGSRDHLAQHKNWANLLYYHCSAYFSKTKNIMWRGLGHSVTEEFAEYPCPRNRKPKDTNSVIHDIANQWFNQHTGVNYRSDSMFATGSASQAKGYGNVYAVFPIGEFKFCWSPSIRDFTFDIADDLVTELRYQPEEDPAAEKKVFDVMNRSMYQTTDLKRAILSGNEIMVHCNKYYAVLAENVDSVMSYIWDPTGL